MKINNTVDIASFITSRDFVSPLGTPYLGNSSILKKVPLLVGLGLMVLLLTSVSVQASNLYVRAGATGSNNGSDWTNAYTDLPESITRGDTYYVADGSYGGHTINQPGTSIITIKKATVSDHGTDAGWSNTYGDGTAVFVGNITIETPGYVVIDGQTRGSDWKTGYGFKIDVRNGDHGLQLGTPFVTTISNITIRYLEIEGDGVQDGPKTGRSVNGGYNHTNITFEYVYFHDSGESIIRMAKIVNLLIQYSWFARDDSTAAVHAGGLICSEGCSDVTVRHNFWEDIEGTAFIETPTSGHPGCSGTNQSNWYIYGNVFFRPSVPARSATGNGVVYIFDANHTGDFHVYNNNFINLTNSFVGAEASSGSQGCISNMQARNNLFYKNQIAAGISCGSVSTCNVTHNAFFGGDPASGTSNYAGGSGSPFTNWVTNNFTLTSSVAAAMMAGVTLASPYNTDLLGNSRGADGKWDRGVFEFQSGSPPPILKIPNPPIIIQIQ